LRPPLTSNVRPLAQRENSRKPQYPSSMRAQSYFESESSAGFSVGVGCPSFGGQRTGCGGSGRLRAGLVTGLKAPQPALVSRSQLEASSGVAVHGESSAAWSWFSRSVGRREKMHCKVGRSVKYQMPELPTPQRSSTAAQSQSLSAVVVSRSGHLLAQPGWPNPSVKGTSRKRAAPYVER
jgi:hypothetical protein